MGYPLEARYCSENTLQCPEQIMRLLKGTEQVPSMAVGTAQSIEQSTLTPDDLSLLLCSLQLALYDDHTNDFDHVISRKTYV